MLEQLSSLLPGSFNPDWMIPAVGGAITLLAFVLGRFFLGAGRPAPAQAEALTKAGNQAIKGVVSDRRSAPRRAGNTIEVSLWDGSENPHLRALVQDRSVGGLRLLAEEPIPKGTAFKVRPRYAPVSTPWTTVIVRGCRPEEGQWEVRCQFEQTPSYNVLLMFG